MKVSNNFLHGLSNSRLSMICPRQLVQMLEEDGDAVLIIDCRPFMVYNASHIKSAHNVHWPPIVKRRSGNHMALENIIRCSHTRGKLSAGLFHSVIAYDERSISLSQLPKDANIIQVLHSLEKQTNLKSTHFLEGGFERFRSEQIQLCTAASASLPNDSSSELTDTTRGYLSVPIPLPTYKQHGMLDKGDPVELLPWLYLGSAWHSRQVSILKRLGVTALLNVSSSEPTPPPPFAVKSKRLPVDDTCTSDISCWFGDAVKFIDREHSNGGKILVHCLAGISRSATICLAYLMKHLKFSLDQAFDYLKEKREIISPNLNFMRQLQEYEETLKKEIPIFIQKDKFLLSSPISAPLILNCSESNTRVKRRAISLQSTPYTKQSNAFVFDIKSIKASTALSPTLVESTS